MIKLTFKDPKDYETSGHREYLEQCQKILNDKVNDLMQNFTTYGTCSIFLPDIKSLDKMIEEKLE